MDYCENLGRIFSASDDGKVLLWDLQVEKIIQKYANLDKTGNLEGLEKPRKGDPQQITYSTEFRVKQSCPTAMAASNSGNLCFVAYTDDSLQMLDTRAPDSVKQFLSGGHTGMVKSILVSQDESLMYTGGQDGLVKLWDIGKMSVVQTFG